MSCYVLENFRVCLLFLIINLIKSSFVESLTLGKEGDFAESRSMGLSAKAYCSPTTNGCAGEAA
jgi:hypothetical protein